MISIHFSSFNGEDYTSRWDIEDLTPIQAARLIKARSLFMTNRLGQGHFHRRFENHGYIEAFMHIQPPPPTAEELEARWNYYAYLERNGQL